MICANCGKQFHDRRIHKYCPKCAPIVQRKQQKQWRKAHPYAQNHVRKTGKFCPMCGVVELHDRQRYCPACSVEHRRQYQREYKRRQRELQKNNAPNALMK